MKEYKFDQLLVEFDGVSTTTVYAGGMSWLKKAELKWRTDDEMSKWFGIEAHVLTADEVIEQVEDKIITIVIESPLSGEIWQYGNYPDGEWHLVGELRGYA